MRCDVPSTCNDNNLKKHPGPDIGELKATEDPPRATMSQDCFMDCLEEFPIPRSFRCQGAAKTSRSTP